MSDSADAFRALAAKCRWRAAAPGDYDLYKLILGYGARGF